MGYNDELYDDLEEDLLSEFSLDETEDLEDEDIISNLLGDEDEFDDDEDEYRLIA